MKKAGEEFKQKHDAIPNVFHNSLPTRKQVAYIAYASAFMSVVGGVGTGVHTFVRGYALAFSANVSYNTLSNAAQRGRLFGEFLRKRSDCKKLLN